MKYIPPTMKLCIQANTTQFFTRLTTLLKSAHTDHSAVHLSQKRLSYTETSSPDSQNDPLSDLNPPNPLPVLIRASNGAAPAERKAGKKVKFSTVVQPGDLEGFYERYAEVCKKGFEGLKKRDRSKKKKKGKAVKKDGE